MSSEQDADAMDYGVVHLVAEYWPYARTGGLAEAARGIATHQAMSGISTSVVMPLYRSIKQEYELEPVGAPFEVPLGPTPEWARLYRSATSAEGPTVYFVDHEHYYDRKGIYSEGGRDYPDNHRRFAFLARAALEALPKIEPRVVVLHSHDWHTSLAPVYLKTVYAGNPFYDQMATILSAHNAGYQGWFGPEILGEIGLPQELFHWSRMEFFGMVNWLKGGLVFADSVGTVSPTHAYELRTPAGGFGLHDAFIALGDRLVGILNGIDLGIWDPSTDPEIAANYDVEDLDGKKACKADLQEACGLSREPDVPLVGMTARLTEQKGFDIILADGLLDHLDAQFVFLGEGEARYRNALSELSSRHPHRIATRFEFTEQREHRLLAGADILMMPSLYEPCGLTQMRAQVYGAIPVVRRVGGLSDTVDDQVTGFVFDDYQTAALRVVLNRAFDAYGDRDAWQTKMRTAMRRDFGWSASAERYLEVYRTALAAHRHS
ncbi:MAG: glycogen synthase [Longimicrobiales bacterium]